MKTLWKTLGADVAHHWGSAQAPNSAPAVRPCFHNPSTRDKSHPQPVNHGGDDAATRAVAPSGVRIAACWQNGVARLNPAANAPTITPSFDS
jgi:hypothetical protein